MNRLQIPSIIAGLVNNPLPPPPPLPPVNLTALTTEELQLMESVERAGVEARIKHLQEIRTLMDAAAFKMDQYASLNITAPSTTPSTTSPPAETTTEAEPEVLAEREVSPELPQNTEPQEDGESPFISVVENPAPVSTQAGDSLEADEEIVIEPDVPVNTVDGESLPTKETVEPDSVNEEPKPTNPFEALRSRDVSPEEQGTFSSERLRTNYRLTQTHYERVLINFLCKLEKIIIQ